MDRDLIFLVSNLLLSGSALATSTHCGSGSAGQRGTHQERLWLSFSQSRNTLMNGSRPKLSVRRTRDARQPRGP